MAESSSIIVEPLAREEYRARFASHPVMDVLDIHGRKRRVVWDAGKLFVEAGEHRKEA